MGMQNSKHTCEQDLIGRHKKTDDNELSEVPFAIDEGDNDDGGETADELGTPQSKRCLDPRSPNIYRTPLPYIELETPPNKVTKQQNLRTADMSQMQPIALLREKLIGQMGGGGQAVTVFDPRSPSQYIARTPLNLSTSNAINDESFDGSLLVVAVEADASAASIEPINVDAVAADTKMNDEECVSLDVVEAEATTTTVPIVESNAIETPKIDPRSPSLNVDRTPLVLSGTEDAEEEKPQPTQDDVAEQSVNVPVVVAAAAATKGVVLRQQQQQHKQIKNSIYKDDANDEMMMENLNIGTPTKKVVPHKLAAATGGTVRTPLGCLGNVSSATTTTTNTTNGAAGRMQMKMVEQQKQQASSSSTATPKMQHHNNKPFKSRISLTNSSKIPVFKLTK